MTEKQHLEKTLLDDGYPSDVVRAAVDQYADYPDLSTFYKVGLCRAAAKRLTNERTAA